MIPAAWMDSFTTGDLSQWAVKYGGMGVRTDRTRTGDYSMGITESSIQATDLAEAQPPNLAGGAQPEYIEYAFHETTNSSGSAVVFYDSSGGWVAGFGTSNPDFEIEDGDGYTQISGGAYETWFLVHYTFNWTAGTYDMTVTDEKGGGNGTTVTGRALGGTNIERIMVRNYGSGALTGSHDGQIVYAWFDDFKVKV